MKTTRNRFLTKSILLIITIIIASISTIFGINGYDKLCFIFSFIGYITMIIGVIKLLKNYTSITIVYLGFMFLYTYSGTYSVLWGDGLHSIFTPEYKPSVFMILSNVAYCSLLAGFLLNKNKNTEHDYSNIKEQSLKYSEIFLNRATICAYIAFFMEFINFLRVGGVSALVQGKAYYSSSVSNLTLTLPGEIITTISMIYFSIFFCYRFYNTKKAGQFKIIFFAIPIIAVLLLYTLLGRRGLLLTFAIIVFIGYSYYRPIRKVSLKLLVGVFILYIALSVLYSSRAYIGYYLFEQKDLQGLISIVFEKERFLKALMPYNNEFGVAFGNFNEYYISAIKDVKLGVTYLKGFLLLIPSWFYPGEKPLQILYEFRNIYFPSEASRGSIASTGFSFLLEAYMNFRVYGVALVYFIIGIILARLESIRIRKWNSPLYISFYLGCFSVINIFQRNAFGDILSTLVMYTGIVWLTSYKAIIKVASVNNETYLSNNINQIDCNPESRT